MPTSHNTSPSPGHFGTIVELHQLRIGDVFEFDETDADYGAHSSGRFPRGRMTVVVKPWGVRTESTGPVSPWMFACRDGNGRIHHFSTSPHLRVKLLEHKGS